MSRLLIHFMQLSGIAKYKNGTTAEDKIPLTVIVLDQNDNPPYFELHSGNITETSKKGKTLTMEKSKRL